MVDSNKLRDTINSKGFKLKFIAEQLGITTYGLSKKINNVNEFKINEVSKLSEILNLDLEVKEAIFFAHDAHSQKA